MATQNRIARWVDDMEHHRPEFQPAVSKKSFPLPRDTNRLRRSPPSHRKRPPPDLSIYPPPPGSISEDSEDYAAFPGPMPQSAPAPMTLGQPSPIYPPVMDRVPPTLHPMLTPPPMMVPQTYLTSPHRLMQPNYPFSRHRSPPLIQSSQPSTYYSVAPTPVVSPAYQYIYPPVSAGSMPGYIILPQSHRKKTHPVMVSTDSFLSSILIIRLSITYSYSHFNSTCVREKTLTSFVQLVLLSFASWSPSAFGPAICFTTN